ncbi:MULTISPECIES: pyridoxamine 5'-phosphate oxidase family protein [Rhodococcus]|uniref:pyridoxamine 5'-phosphate oxidase family protein n=1 Tax=Rhodococcus globerulus TaxID=33008 RepID=UPI001C597F4A|nr:pyridoxamine 5'-phosphate oxidase family protein [Rhodococcus globerulus]QXW02968.1 pyridoxamine 5'-phosphate oxidase family protein [Rhodococcus globerulus]
MTANDLSSNSPVAVLSAEESWKLLSQATLGRIVVGTSGHVDIFPVNYVVDDNHIYFRTAEGAKLVELTINDRVLFEADHVGPEQGWSVVVRGTARVITSFTETARIDELGLRSWIPTPKYNVVEITASEITGRAVKLDHTQS